MTYNLTFWINLTPLSSSLEVGRERKNYSSVIIYYGHLCAQTNLEIERMGREMASARRGVTDRRENSIFFPGSFPLGIA